MQVGVIVAGVLASGVWHKMAIGDNIRLPYPVMFLYGYGVWGLFIPLIWILCTMLIGNHPHTSDWFKILMLWSGVLLILALAEFVLFANISPLLSITFTLSGND